MLIQVKIQCQLIDVELMLLSKEQLLLVAPEGMKTTPSSAGSGTLGT